MSMTGGFFVGRNSIYEIISEPVVANDIIYVIAISCDAARVVMKKEVDKIGALFDTRIEAHTERTGEAFYVGDDE